MPRAIILGESGSGKTSLMNQVCGTNYETGSGKSCITQHFYLSRNVAGYGEFDVTDTPCNNEALLREALECASVHVAFLLIKYHSRFNRVIAENSALINMALNARKKIVIITTHWDHSRDKESDSNAIYETFLSNGYENHFIFYSN